jgi:hypothetical protein
MRDRFPRVGVATVQDRRGRVYHGHVTVSDGMVMLRGWRAVRPWHSAAGEFETRYTTVKTWPIGAIDVITWTAEDSFEMRSVA